MYVAGLAWTLGVWVGGFCARQFLNMVATPSLPSFTPPPLMSTTCLRSPLACTHCPIISLTKSSLCPLGWCRCGARAGSFGDAPQLGGFCEGGYVVTLHSNPPLGSQPPWSRKNTYWIDKGKED